MTKLLKILGSVFIVLAIGAFLTIGSGFYLLNKTLDEGCERIAQIARDESVVAYLDNWASQHILDLGYYRASGMHGTVYATSETGGTFVTPLPDPKITGIEIQYLRFGVEKIDDEFYAPITSDNVGHIRFGRGRNNIFLLKNGQSLRSYRDHDESSGHILRISDSVFAYCEDAKFKM